MRHFNRVALNAYKHGSANGTITDSITEIISIIDEQEVVSYCSEKGSYTFDNGDISDPDGDRAYFGFSD